MKSCGSGEGIKWFCGGEANGVDGVGYFAHRRVVGADWGEPIIPPLEQIAAWRLHD